FRSIIRLWCVVRCSSAIPGSRSTFIRPSWRRRRKSRATANPTCSGISTGSLDESVNRTLADNDPLAYGFKASRAVLETMAQYVHEQGLSARQVKLEELFAASTLDM